MSDFGLNPQPYSLLTDLFGDPDMAAIFSFEATVRSWLDTEAALALAQGAAGSIDPGAADAIASACEDLALDRARLLSEARAVGYPILPLVRQVADALPDGPNGRVHFGATTQDIMDTGLVLQLRRATQVLEERLTALGDALAFLAEAHVDTVQAARTHGQHAVPTSFGAKMAVFLDQTATRLEQARRVTADVATVSLFGAGGTSAALGERVRETRADLAGRLELNDAAVPWHVNRDRIVSFGDLCADSATIAIRLAREVIDLSRTEIAEVREPGGHHAGASSTMPQKANPVLAESALGLGATAVALAPALRRAAEAGHERSSGEWQIEWHVLPQVATLASSALVTMTTLLNGLEVMTDRMAANLHQDHSLLLAEAYMIRLADHLGRERAHDLVYDAARTARATGRTLPDVLRDEDTLDVEAILPADYLGDVGYTVAASVQRWRTLTKESIA